MLVQLALGIVNFLTTFILYSLLVLLVAFAAKAWERKCPSVYKSLLAVIPVLITLFVCEIALWFFIRPEDCLSYYERLGNYSYHSNTLLQKFRLINRYIPDTWQWIAVNEPNTNRFIGEPNHQYEHRYNAVGFRDVDVPIQKKPGEIRIMALGDSFTEGVGTPTDSTWPYLLNLQLRSDSVYHVMNCGASGSDPFFEYMLLKCRLLPYKPDAVIVCFNQSDIFDVIERGGFERFLPDSTICLKPSPNWEYLYAASMVTRLVAHRVLHYNWLLRQESEFKQMQQEALDKLKNCVDSFRLLAQQHHFKLLLVMHPLLSDFKQQDRQLVALLNQFHGDDTMLAVNLFDEFQKQMEKQKLTPEQLYWPVDLHNNSTGYRLWSQVMAVKIREFVPAFKP